MNVQSSKRFDGEQNAQATIPCGQKLGLGKAIEYLLDGQQIVLNIANANDVVVNRGVYTTLKPISLTHVKHIGIAFERQLMNTVESTQNRHEVVFSSLYATLFPSQHKRISNAFKLHSFR